MSSLIHWEVARARERELRNMEAAVDAHPFARFVALQFLHARSTSPRSPSEARVRPGIGTAPASSCR
jgi:hypothetical protein